MIIKCFKYNRDNPTVVEVLDNQDIDENDYFCLLLHTLERLEINKYTLLLSDIPFDIRELVSSSAGFWYELHIASVSEYFSLNYFKSKDYVKDFFINEINQKGNFSKLFLNYPEGICEITLQASDLEESLIGMNINIHSNKINSNEFESLVEYVATKKVSVWSKSSLLRNDATNLLRNESFLWLVIYFKDFLNDLKNKYLIQFSYDKIYSLVPKNTVLPFTQDLNISENSVSWLLENLDVLQVTNSQNPDRILLQNRLFVPNEILSEELITNTDIYENRLIHGFISELDRYFTWQRKKIEEELKQKGEPNILNFESKIEFYYLKTIKSHINNILSSVIYIKKYLTIYLPVSYETTDLLNSYKFESKEHYFFIYKHLLEWFNKKDVKFESPRKLFGGIRRMDKLFELACLYKIIDCLSEQGYDYNIIMNNKKQSDTDFVLFFEQIPSKIQFFNSNNSEITLYYEVLPEKLTSVGNIRNLKPDFVLEYSTEKYLICDAKYKKYDTIEEYDYPSLSLKYLHGIGYKNGGYFSPIGLFVLFPNEKEETKSYHQKEFSIYGKTPVFPAIGSVSIGFKDENKSLERLLKKISEL